MNLNEIDIKNMSAVKPVKISSSDVAPKLPEHIDIPIGKKAPVVDLRQKYNLTQEQYNVLCQKYPNLSDLNEITISNIIKQEFTAPVAPEVNKTEVETEVAETEVTETEASEDPTNFNFNKYSQLSQDEQLDVYSIELAKNKFIYGAETKKTAQDWDKLSQEEKQKLIDIEKNDVNKDSIIPLSSKMTFLQAANHHNMSIDKFNKQPPVKLEDDIHDYIFSLDDEFKTKGQSEYLKYQQAVSDVVINKLKEAGKEIGDANMSPAEIDNLCKNNNINKVDVTIEVLKNKSNKSDKEKNLLNFLETVKDTPKKDYGRLSAFKESEYYSSDFDTLSLEDKIKRYREFSSANFGSMPIDERSKAITEFASELIYERPELANEFYGNAVEGATPELQAAMAKVKTGLAPELNAANINSFENGELVADSQKELSKTDAKRAASTASLALEVADEKHLNQASQIYSGFGIKEVEDKHAAIALDKDRVGVETQDAMLKNVAANSNSETAKNTAIQLDKAYKENQISATKNFSERKECNDAMIKNGTFSRYAIENQTEAFKMHKARCERDDYSKDEAIKNLNKLSDWISNCDKKNQLDMHNEIMNTKYSEVQEHAAGNIKNYDPSVQADAMSTVYQSGNQKAIETAIDNIANIQSPDVKEQVLQHAVMELANTGYKSDLSEKFANGTLTNADISKLTPVQRKDYFIKLFKNASPLEKIALIGKIPNGVYKKSIYKSIALYSSTLLTQMVESGKGQIMFEICGDIGAQNKILQAMRKSENQTVKEQYAQIAGDPRNSAFFSGEEKTQTAKTINYSSDPFASELEGLNGLEFLAKKDKFGVSYLNA